MEKVFAVIGLAILVFALAMGLGLLFAYPTMWAVNYLFAPSFLTFVFGTAKIGFWQAVILNFISGWLIKSTNTSSSSK